MPEQPTPKRGRRPLTPEQKAESAERRREYYRAYAKAHGRTNKRAWDISEQGVASAKARMQKYRSSHYQFQISIPASKKELLLALVNKERQTPSNLFVDLVQEKYGIDLS